MADVLYQSIREGVNQRLAEQVDGTYAQVYVAAPQQALPTDVLFQSVREGVNKKLALQSDGTWAEVIQVIGGGSGGNYQYIPYMTWISSATASSGQVFMNSNLALYSNILDVDLFISGGRATPLIDFTLSGTSITIPGYLNSNSRLIIDSKLVPLVAQTYYALYEDSGRIILAQGDGFVQLEF